jgi:hypothetical protein
MLRCRRPEHEVASRATVEGEWPPPVIPLFSWVAVTMPFRPSLERARIEMVSTL